MNHSFLDFDDVDRAMALMELIIEEAYSDYREIIYSLEGRPVNERIRSSWLIVELPGNMGFPSRSSPKIHPMPQISADLV